MPLKNSKPNEILLRELAGLLHGFRKFRGAIGEATVTITDPDSYPGEIQAYLDKGIVAFERTRELRKRKLIAIEHARRLGRDYGIPDLMFEPFLAAVTTDSIVCQPFENFFDSANTDMPSGAGMGNQANYRFQSRRLEGVDAAVVHLELTGSASSPGYSDTHWHTGDEIIFMIRGSAELRFANSGVHVALHDHDYAQFYSEQPHQLVQLSDGPCEALIIRFYQLFPEGSRMQAMSDAETLLVKLMNAGAEDKVGDVVSRDILNRVTPCFRQWVALSSEILSQDRPQLNDSSQIVDQVGCHVMLHHFLKLWPDEFNREKLSKKIKKSKTGVHNELTDVTKPISLSFADVKVESAEYGCIKPPLFYPFFFPSVPRLCVVRSSADYYPFPKENKRTYQVPVRRLAGSDCSIAVLELEPGGKTVFNRHPGIEMLYPISGSAVVNFQDGQLNPDDISQRLVSSQQPGFLYFKSKNIHQVCHHASSDSDADEVCRLLVIRFYDSALNEHEIKENAKK